MKITRRSPITGKINSIDVNVTDCQIRRYNNRNENIQNVFPNLTPGEREFILTGITEEEWNTMFMDSEDLDSEDLKESSMYEDVMFKQDPKFQKSTIIQFALDWWNGLPLQDIRECENGWANLVMKYYPGKTNCQDVSIAEILLMYIYQHGL